MRPNAISRRRFIGIAGAVAGMALFPAVGEARVHHWNGVVMGARATIQLVHSDAGEAQRVIRLVLREIERLEGIFSLYRPESAVSRLNRDGHLTAPPLELVDLFTRAAAISALSDGVFDMTIQPLWARYRDHFIADPDAATLPSVDDILPLVDWRAVEVTGEAITLRRIGMAITPNGIAQGYITDCIADLLRRNGIDRVALNLGEVRTMGRRIDGGDWVVGIMDPGDREQIAGRIVSLDRAVATSGGYGTIFDHAKQYSHLLDPRTGKTAPIGRSVTVVAAEACFADACSTAFALRSSSEIRDLVRRLGDIDVYIAATDSGLERLV
jgi:thiamine biosynthesis lipoprotein